MLQFADVSIEPRIQAGYPCAQFRLSYALPFRGSNPACLGEISGPSRSDRVDENILIPNPAQEKLEFQLPQRKNAHTEQQRAMRPDLAGKSSCKETDVSPDIYHSASCRNVLKKHVCIARFNGLLVEIVRRNEQPPTQPSGKESCAQNCLIDLEDRPKRAFCFTNHGAPFLPEIGRAHV